MADRPLASPLPADLPEDWTSGQTIAPAGADVGLSEQHGYNYLMAAVNRAQSAVNAINESFDNISGKRTCRVVVGTSTAGWTQADCDYLCNGTDDQNVLRTAVQFVRGKGGGEIAILAGEYNLSGAWGIESEEKDEALTFSGEPGSTVFNLADQISIKNNWTSAPKFQIRFLGISFHSRESIQCVYVSESFSAFENCAFQNVVVNAQYISNGSFVFRNNDVGITGSWIYTELFSADGGGCSLIEGNTFKVTAYTGLENIFRFSAISMGTDDVLTDPIIANNTIVCIGAAKEVYVRAAYRGLIANNSVAGATIWIESSALCVGNNVLNGRIYSYGAKTVINSNKVDNGSIVTMGYSAITGNTVSAPSGVAAIAAKKWGANNFYETPNITGNTIASGGIGVHLQTWSVGDNDPTIRKALVTCNRIANCTVSIQIESNWKECLVTGNMIDGPILDSGTDNIVRLNSNDTSTGGGGGGTAGVTSFKGRFGAVTPQAGDYTATMVGAHPDTWTPTAADVGAISAGSVSAIQTMTQEQYDALTSKDAGTLYLIKE